MANPANITLRSEKGSFLTFEEMDLNLVELQNLINEYETFTNSTYANHASDFNDLQTAYDQYVIDTNNRLDINEQDIVDISAEQGVQANRLTQAETEITNLQLSGGLVDQGTWDNTTLYFINDFVLYSDGLTYVSVSNNNSQEPVSGQNTPYWIVLTAKSVAEFVSYDNTNSDLVASDVQDAIDEVSARDISDFSSPEYTIQTTAFTAEAGGWYSLDASTSGFTITLPATPSIGDIIEFLMVDGNVKDNNLTVARNGQTIESLAEDMIIENNYPRSFAMYYNGTTWRVFV